MRDFRVADESYRWTMLAAAVAIICVSFGILFSLSVFFGSLEASMKWSRAAISSVALVNWIAMGFGSFLWGSLSDRIGTRAVVMIGGGLLGLALVLSSQVTSFAQFYITFGVMVGLAVGCFYTPLNSTVTRWFSVNRGLAVAIASTGIGLGVLLVAPLSRWLIEAFGWRVAMLLLGDLAWLLVIPLALLIRNAPETGASSSSNSAPGLYHSMRTIARTPQFWAIALTHFACCAAHSGPIFHMVTHVTDQGILPMAAATVYGISGLGSIGGRIVSGISADRFGATRTLIVLLGLQAAIIGFYLVTRDLLSFYLLGLSFGVAYGGVMPLYALVTRDYFGDRVMGTAFGAVFFVSCLGMGLGSFSGGWFYDHLGTYTWLFGTSVMIGTAAWLVALTIRPKAALPV